MGLESTTTPPTTVSREEHTSITSSTPQSFGDIPPILRFEDDVEITLSPGEGSSSSVSIEGRIQGRLWVTEQEVVFIPSTGTGSGFKLNYQSLTLHALTPASAELEAHLYCQIDDSPSGGGGDGDEYGEMRELRVFIQDNKLSPLFEALSDCSALHDSLLPSGETSSFPFFPPGEDDEEWEEEEEEEDEDMNGNGAMNENGGRVILQKKAGGQIMISLASKKDEEGGDVDQMERFLDMVDWGNVPKPAEWVEGAYDDAPEEAGEVEDIHDLAKRISAVDITQT